MSGVRFMRREQMDVTCWTFRFDYFFAGLPGLTWLSILPRWHTRWIQVKKCYCCLDEVGRHMYSYFFLCRGLSSAYGSWSCRLVLVLHCKAGRHWRAHSTHFTRYSFCSLMRLFTLPFLRGQGL